MLDPGLLDPDLLAVSDVRNRHEFRDAIVRFARELGFSTVSATAVVDHTVGQSEFYSEANLPHGYSDAFVNHHAAQRDPVMQHCKANVKPIIWTQKTYVEHGVADLWEEQARFGYFAGVCLAMHLPDRRHFMLGVERDQALPADRLELRRLVAEVQLFTVVAMETAMRVLVPSAQEADAPLLTPRELEALRWTMEGKTAWEVGRLMSVSERTAVLHINNATHKLGCVSKHQAVLKALRQGLIR
jgi:DNA-binding CsgD family transcriptional regulator